jgi:hypothetical protein
MTTFNGTLDVTISDAQGIEQQHLSKQDPYCILTLGSSGAKRFVEGSSLGKERYKTKVHNGGGQHPVWNESHTFNLKNMKLDSHLKVKLYDKDTIKDDYIGVATINLEELLLHDKKGVKYFPLFKKKMLGTEGRTPIGQVGIGVSFNCTEIPQGHADIKSQVRDAAVRKEQQVAGVSEPHQQAKPTHVGPGQLKQEHQATIPPQQLQGQGQQGYQQPLQGQGQPLQGQQGYQVQGVPSKPTHVQQGQGQMQQGYQSVPHY